MGRTGACSNGSGGRVTDISSLGTQRKSNVVRFDRLFQGRAVTYLIDDIDKGLDVAPSEAMDHIDCIPTREDRLDKRGSFALDNGAADQA
jgi:hypothetical protein